MADEAGIISTDVAVKLLLLDNAKELQALSAAGWFGRVGINKWRTVELVHGRIKQLKQAADMVSSGRLAEIFNVHSTQLLKLEREGWIRREANNQWSLLKVISGVMRYYTDPARRANKSATDSRVGQARAREIELRTAQRAGELCETAEAVALVDDIVGMLRADLSGLPAMVTRDLNIRRDIEKALNDILNRIAARLILQADALEKGGEVISRPVALDS
jgi:hypothetical protein